MSQYGYDERISLHDSDRDQNNAQAIENFTGILDPQEEWPGEDPDVKEPRYDIEQMRNIATELEAIAYEIEDSSAPERVSSLATNGAGMSAGGFGSRQWAGAAYLDQASQHAARLSTEGVSLLVTNLKAAVEAIRTAADGYEKAEDANEAAFKGAGD